MRTGLTVVAIAVGIAAARTAGAQTPCPPDGWFCDDAEASPAPAPAESDAPPDAAPAEPPAKPRARRSRPPIVVYSPEGQEEGERRGSLLERRQQALTPAWGLNMRLQGVLMSQRERQRDTGMGGVGASLRYQPLPFIALDLGADLLGGTDYNGFDRGEVVWSLSALLFFNPKKPLQLYSIAGLNTSFAAVEVAYDDGTVDDQDWHYFGGHLGLGLQASLGPRVALNVDLLGVLRGRTDSRAKHEPEFIDSHGRMTNMSGGGLLRGGLTFFW